MLSRKVRGIAAGAIVAGVAVLVSSQVFAGRSTPLTLGGKDRYLTSVSTDKPIYHPGEKVYARGAVLHAFTHAPLPANQECYEQSAKHAQAGEQQYRRQCVKNNVLENHHFLRRGKSEG